MAALEDSIGTSFFHYLWKKRPPQDDGAAEPDVRVPHTLVFEHGFPKGWYSCLGPRGLVRSTGKDIDATAVTEAMVGRVRKSLSSSPLAKRLAKHTARPPCDRFIVATYIERKQSPEGTCVYQQSFLSKKGLEAFFSSGADASPDTPSAVAPQRNGLLQQFVIPPGVRNQVIEVDWSQHACFIEKRRNIHALCPDMSLAQTVTKPDVLSPWERAVTYQGPANYSEKAYVSPNVEARIRQVCAASGRFANMIPELNFFP
ncbi:hypothetical protein DIPPA_22005 [Diplonema papillatum]|nr:hypothetical protein DIPPA_22005 [Diplonema papillatum]